jgi:predicted acetyltransferase
VKSLTKVSNIKLAEPDVCYESSFKEGFGELTSLSDQMAWVYLGENHSHYLSSSFDDYVKTLVRRKTTPPPGFVCDSVYWAILHGSVIGRIAIRHELNESLARVGGHIGYIPSFCKGQRICNRDARLDFRIR